MTETQAPPLNRIEVATPDLTEENIEKILTLFPDVATEVQDPQAGETKRTVDFDALRERLGDVAEGARERYRFTWPGKRAAKEEARRSIDKTLRPVKDRSKNWDDTHNLYIEGDNLDALKILRQTYAGQIKMIYIDPPYNTGHDFVYNDAYVRDAEKERAGNAAFDDDGNLLDGAYRENKESYGRFHSAWCSMIYPRLLLSRDLLTSDGVVFISIDDNEDAQLRKICDEVFGEANFIVQMIWKKRSTPPNDQVIGAAHEYALVYAKDSSKVKLNLRERSAEQLSRYKNPDNHPKGPWVSGDLSANVKGGRYVASLNYPITNPNTGEEHYPPNGGNWRYSRQTVEKMLQNNEIYFGVDGKGRPKVKRFLRDIKQGITYTSLWDFVPFNAQGSAEMAEYMGNLTVFDNPKPVGYIRELLKLGSFRESIVLDFFSGSATTAHAVMQLNAEDGGNRKFIMVQLPEVCAEKSEAAKAGFHTICEIGEERIRRAGERIKTEVEESNTQLELGAEPKRVPDIGFRVLRVEDSNYRDVRRSPNEMTQDMLDDLVDVSKSDRTTLDKLFECLPTFQLPYDSSIEVLDAPAFAGHTVYSVNGGQLVACFDAEIPESLIRGMASLDPKPSYAVLAEAGLKNSQTVTNFAEIFKQAANADQGATQVRVI
ncbi:site-specific DNA-methyltransferase [Bifidobacterium sp. 82T24]|uniref:site-specific DNA-methyltransferase n=1 Tax=Bifidobacterium pluvialisilvae TaxID=2834436 RepID=UPI001C56F444|nr:site-specific DNA-methyltransferase [Bifidobacterium pluvialisilvae]MBW3088078.1 site-specific DNA-methyltransferase [Bifidobacterium pluvialisilvae]